MDTEISIADVLLAQEGNKDAFVRLIKRVEPSLYRVARSILKSDAECLDAAQEAILNAYKSIHALKEASYFKTWIIRILINECYRLAKERNKVILIGDLMEKEPAFPPISEGLPFEDQMEVQEAIDSLEKDLQSVITLYYLEDLSIKFIADVLKIPQGTVKSRLARARQKLAELLIPHPEERGVGVD